MGTHGPLPDSVRETIDLWVSDFLDRPAARTAADRVGEHGGAIASAFLEAACHGGKEPSEIAVEDVSHALLDHVADLSLPPGAKAAAPDLVAALLQDLQDVGRLADGGALASVVRAASPTYRARASGRGPDLTRKGSKIGRNDPCTCGSGKKYKQCCLRLAG
jgi:hypothetical protein